MNSLASRRELARKVERRLVRYRYRQTVRMRNPRPIVTFTFDDFPQSAATVGAPILEANGARGTFYLAGGTLGQPQDLEPGSLVEPDLIATPEQVEDLSRAGHEIGCHTFSHVAVTTLDRRELGAECERNHPLVPGDADRRQTAFAYPFGSVDLAGKREASRRHASCRSLLPGVNAGKADLGYLRAINLRDQDLDVRGVDGWLDEAGRQRGWLIFCTHDVRPEPSRWGVTPSLLRYAVDRAVQQGAEVLPMNRAVERLSSGG